MSEDKVFCRKCGSSIFNETEICPLCGVRQFECVTTIVKPKPCKFCYKKYHPKELYDGYCPTCLDKIKVQGHKNPYVALFIGLIPSAGYFYIGMKAKGNALIGILFISMWIPILGWLLIPFFWLGGAGDAYNQAVRINKILDKL